MRIVEMGSGSPFSFFNLIFLPTLDLNPAIIEHERIHTVQRHWIDLIVVEIACALLWFNPIVFFYRRSIKLQHEYQADGGTLLSGLLVEQYLHCILSEIESENGIAPVSRFYSQTIKKRIIMMTKNKTALRVSSLYLISIPAICMLLFAFSSERTSIPTQVSASSKDGEKIIIIDAGHGGDDDGAGTADGINEKDIVLSIAREIERTGQEKGIKVILTRSDDVAITLSERLLLAERFSADLFISLHVGVHPQTNVSGIECIVSEENAKFIESKRLAEFLVSQLSTLEGIAVKEMKKSKYYVLKNSSVPAVMLELGYLSNKGDFAFLRNTKNQKILSERIIAGVSGYVK
jgi:N-acetylmuramoyl-L-alanine amidase